MSEGEMVVGEYELRNCVATGTVSQIWEVVERGGTHHFAMKLLLPEAHEEREQKAVLKHEFKVGQQLEHPNFVRFYKIEVNRDHSYFIMDYFRAPSLKSQISSDLTGVHIRFRKLVDQSIMAISAMHDAGWLHRDIKPENILMNRGSEVRVIDFSLACRKGKGNRKQIQGTRTYIAPETLLKKKPTFQTDMYSYGVTLFEALTGVPPFTGLSPNDLLKKHVAEEPPKPSFVNPNVTPEADQFILRFLKKRPKDRPKDMKEAHAEFRSLQVFHERPEELAEKHRQEAEEERMATVDQRLDSRLDDERTRAGIKAPPRKKKKVPKIKPKEPATPEPAAPQQQPGYMPQPMMPQPMMPQPMMPQPMMPQPMMPQPMMPQPMPPQPVMQQPMMPQQPGAPLQPVQQQPVQQQPVQQQPVQQQPVQQQPVQQQPVQQQPVQQQPVQQQPVQQQPVQQQPVQQQPVQQQPVQQQPAQQQPAPPAPAPPQQPDEDMPFMTDLPDVS